MDKKGKIEDLSIITYRPVPGGVELFVKSEKIHKFVSEQAVKLSNGEPRLISGAESGWGALTNLSFYKMPSTANNYIMSPADFVRSGKEYSTCLFAANTLGEGVTLLLPGMVAKDTMDNIGNYLRERAILLYKSFIAPYSVKIHVSVNEEV